MTLELRLGFLRPAFSYHESYFVFPFKIKTKISDDFKPFSKDSFFLKKKKTNLAFLNGKRIIAKNAGSTMTFHAMSC